MKDILIVMLMYWIREAQRLGGNGKNVQRGVSRI